MNIFFVLLLLLSGDVNSPSDIHEFHLSNTTINYNTEENALQVSLRMFIDDLELALAPIAGDTLQICTRRESYDAEDHIYDYIMKHLVITSDNQKLSPVFIGKEPSDDLAAVWCYLEFENLDPLSTISITNTIMVSLFDDQKNMINIQKDKSRVKDFLFTNKKTSEKIDFHD